MGSVVSLQGISKSFGDKQALRQISFAIEDKEVFGFLGPSGAGKTTTVKLLTGQIKPSEGQAEVLGRDVTRLLPEDYRNIGVISDNSGLYERLSCWENMLLFARIMDVPAKRVEELLARVGLAADKKVVAKKLSRGMKQRLILARALLHKPRLLFLDEPTTGLDPATALDIHALLREANEEGATIFLTTHNMEEATKLCGRVALLNEGHIAEMDSPRALCRKYASDEIDIEKKDGAHIRLRNVPEDAEKIAALIKAGEAVSIHSVEPNLEQVFLHVTGRDL